VLSRDEFKKIQAKYQYKDRQRAERLIKNGEVVEGVCVLSLGMFRDFMLANIYLKAEKEFNEEKLNGTTCPE